MEKEKEVDRCVGYNVVKLSATTPCDRLPALVSLWPGNVFNVTRLTGQFCRFTIIIFITIGSSLSPHNYFWFSLELKFIDPGSLVI